MRGDGMEPIRWAVLGAGKFARTQMAPAIHAARGAQLAVLATSAPEKAAPFRELEPSLEVETDYAAVLERDDVDAVYVPLPNTLHVEWTRRALEAGKHVLCEKPIAMRAEEIDPLIALRDRTGLVAAEAFMIVHHPQWIKARDLLRAGAIGDLQRVEATFSYDNGADRGNIRNRTDTGGGSLPDIGVYTFGATRFVTDREPSEILYAGITRENGVEVRSEVIAGFEGFTLTSLTSMRMSLRQWVAFQGSEGVMEIAAPFNPTSYGNACLRLRRPGGHCETFRWPGVNQYVLQLEGFGAAIRGEAAFACPLEFSRGTQAAIDMVWEAERRAAA